MPLNLGTFDVMGYLWETLEKSDDGNHIFYTEADVDLLWSMGFVDTASVPLKTWRIAFESHRQPDGIFRLSKEAFLALDQYRYRGDIHIPFDAMLINEGQYTEKGLEELFDASIRPSCGTSQKELNQFLQQLKKDFRNADGLIEIRSAARIRIKKLLDESPSPLRNLELMFDHMLEQGADVEAKDFVAHAADEVFKREAARQQSQFTSTPTSRTEVHAKQFKKIAKAKEKKSAVDEEKTTELKRVRRSPKGIRS